MKFIYKKISQLIILACAVVSMMAFTSEYTRKVDPFPNMSKGNPDPSVGIVVYPDSTGIDILRDSSQNIRFTASKNMDKNAIELLRSSSMVDRNPKKFKFIDEKHGFSSDNTYEFTISFHYKNNKWNFVRFMPFPSVIEWVTEERLLQYAKQWDKTFVDAGWKRSEYKDSDDPWRVQNFKVPKSDQEREYCSWSTDEYEAVMQVMLRNRKRYKHYFPKADLKKLSEFPDGYTAFITISKKSQYRH